MMMYNEPKSWHKMMDKLAEIIIRYLSAQIKSGVDLIQLFDSWIGCLSVNDYEEFVLPYSQKIFKAVKKLNVPSIHFGTGTSHLLELMKKAGGDVIGIDWRINLDEAREKLGKDTAIQGNLDPAVLFAKPAEIKRKIKEVLDYTNNQPGHIFNLGHGILQKTPVENVILLANTVHEYSKRK
jgi:uroporphyrinogen decarboxylase